MKPLYPDMCSRWPIPYALSYAQGSMLQDSNFFCCTSLPLASTRWVQLTLSSLCPLFLAVQSINLSNIKSKILGNARIVPGAAGWEASLIPRCHAAPPPPPAPNSNFHYWNITHGKAVVVAQAVEQWHSVQAGRVQILGGTRLFCKCNPSIPAGRRAISKENRS